MMIIPNIWKHNESCSKPPTRNLLNSETLCGVLPLGCDLRIKSSSLFDMRAKGQCLALGLGARLLCCVLGRSRVENASESWDKPSWLSWSAWQIKFHGFCGTISYRDLDGILQYVHHPAYPAMPCNSAIGDWMTSELSELSTSAKHRHFSSSNAAPWADGVSQTPSGPMKSPPGHRHSLGVFGLFRPYLLFDQHSQKTENLIAHESMIFNDAINDAINKKNIHLDDQTMGPPLHASSDVGQLGSPGPPRWPCQMQGIDLGSRYFAIETPWNIWNTYETYWDFERQVG